MPDAAETAQNPMDVAVNGRFVPAQEATVSIHDAGFTHAVGLFETFQAYHGRVFRLERHLARMTESAKQLGLARELPAEKITQTVEGLLKHNGVQRCRLRLTVTAGAVPMRAPEGEIQPPEPTIAVVPEPPTAIDPAYAERGVTAVIYRQGANPFDDTAGHKTLAYWSRLRSLRQAAQVGAGEALWLNVTNHLASGAVSNLMLVKDGQVFTPIARGEELPEALSAPVRPGVTRETVLELAQGLGLPVHRKMLSVDDLLGADEAMLTNAGWGVLPVTRVEQAEIADGQVGEVTRQLMTGLAGLIDSECGGA